MMNHRRPERTQWRCLHWAVQRYLQAIHHIPAAETHCYQYHPPSVDTQTHTHTSAVLPLLLQFLSSFFLLQSLCPTHFPLSLPLCPALLPPQPLYSSILLSFSSLPSTSLSRPTPPTVCLRVQNTIIYSFVFPFLSPLALFLLVNTKLSAGTKRRALRCQSSESE